MPGRSWKLSAAPSTCASAEQLAEPIGRRVRRTRGATGMLWRDGGSIRPPASRAGAPTRGASGGRCGGGRAARRARACARCGDRRRAGVSAAAACVARRAGAACRRSPPASPGSRRRPRTPACEAAGSPSTLRRRRAAGGRMPALGVGAPPFFGDRAPRRRHRRAGRRARGDRMSGIASASRIGRATDSGRRGRGRRPRRAPRAAPAPPRPASAARRPAPTERPRAQRGGRRSSCSGRARPADAHVRLARCSSENGGRASNQATIVAASRCAASPLSRSALAQRLRREGGDAADAAEQQQIVPEAEPERLGAAARAPARVRSSGTRCRSATRTTGTSIDIRSFARRRARRRASSPRTERSTPRPPAASSPGCSSRPPPRRSGPRSAPGPACASASMRAPVPVGVRGRRLAREREHRRPVDPARLAPRPAQREPARGAEVGGRARGDRHADSIPQRKAEVTPGFAAQRNGFRWSATFASRRLYWTRRMKWMHAGRPRRRRSRR